MIKISNEAASHLKKFLYEASLDDNMICKHAIKLSIKKSGCSGSSYLLRPITISELNNENFSVTIDNGIVIWYDKSISKLVNGCEIILEKDIFVKKITIKNHTLKTETCGCGSSFTIIP